MKTLEWLSKRLVEAIVMAVFVGTIVILAAYAGQRGLRILPGGRK